MQLMLTPAISRLIELAIEEDLGCGDLTSEAIFSPTDGARAVLLAKTDCVICGLPLVPWLLERFPGPVRVHLCVEEGARCTAGDIIGQLQGPVLTLLRVERILLNFLQHLSGIATFSRELAHLVGERIRIVDTRKTLPGWRSLQKYAVGVGGCYNHRFHLGSGVMIKDNHIDACGSITLAVERVRADIPHGMKVEVEVRNEAEAAEAIAAGAEVLLLDNMTPEQIRRICQTHANQALFEISGGVTPATLPSYLDLGADLISLGCLTHSVRAADISMKIQVTP